VENASYGATLCAERIAISKAVSGGHRKISRVIVCGDSEKPVVPCGLCLQVMAEFASQELQVICCDRTGRRKKKFEFQDLLPNRFGGEML
jgi:cytidine deaminase